MIAGSHNTEPSAAAHTSDHAGTGSGRIEHGGSLALARQLFPMAPGPWLDLSTGINPHAFALPLLPASAFTRLPEPGQITRLEEAAASAYGAPLGTPIVAASGTQLLISLVPRLFLSRSVAILAPTYAEHAAGWAAAGSQVRLVSSLSEAAGAKAVVLVNPNNPDGRIIPPEELCRFAAAQSACGGLLVVDEAFADLEGEGATIAPLLPLPGVLVLRSFGKTYGLAGVRLGFALGEGRLIEALRASMGPWAVAGPALEAGLAALADGHWRQAMTHRLEGEAARLDDAMVRLGLRIVGGTRLFRLGEAPAAPDIFNRLGSAGILVRRFSDQPHRLRFGLPGDEAGWQRLEAVQA
jgi:cobalamin biosynthesis protein CobC